MATSCDYCGHKTNEVKSGGGIETRGTRITLRVTDPSDLSRDVLKVSEKSVTENGLILQSAFLRSAMHGEHHVEPSHVNITYCISTLCGFS